MITFQLPIECEHPIISVAKGDIDEVPRLSSFESILSPIPSIESIATQLMAPVDDGPVDIIPGFLPRAGQTVIAGETNIGKTLVALEVVSALVTGNPLWGEIEPASTVKKVLYVLGEHQCSVVQRLWQVTNLPMTGDVLIIGPDQLKYDKWFVSTGKPNLAAVEKLNKWAEGMELIVFDPLSAFCSGVDTENDNIQMRLVLDTMSLIAQTVGASSIVLAHQGKPMMDKFGQEHSRKSYAIRGASAIEDAATNIFYMGKSEGGSSAAQKVTDSKILTLTKRKYKGIAPDEYRLMRDPTTLTHTLLGNRPFVEVLKLDTLSKVAKLQACYPQMEFDNILKGIAAIQGCSIQTLKRYLGQ